MADAEVDVAAEFSGVEVPELESEAHDLAVQGGQIAGAGACAAVGLAAAAPLCSYIGGEIAGWLADEAWPAVEEFFSDVGDAVSGLFGGGDDAYTERVQGRAMARLRLSAIADDLLQTQITAEAGLEAAVSGLVRLKEQLGIVGPYGRQEVLARLAWVHGLPLRPGLPQNWRNRIEFPNASYSPDWMGASGTYLARYVPAVRSPYTGAVGPAYCSRAFFSDAQWSAYLAEPGVAYRAPFVLWRWCGLAFEGQHGGPEAVQLRAARDVVADVVGWTADLQRAAAAEAVLLVRLAAGLRAARELAAADPAYQARLAGAYVSAAGGFTGDTASALKAATKPAKGAGILVVAGLALAAAGGAWWILRRRRRS
jgi:hypothetical protein